MGQFSRNLMVIAFLERTYCVPSSAMCASHTSHDIELQGDSAADRTASILKGVSEMKESKWPTLPSTTLTEWLISTLKHLYLATSFYWKTYPYHVFLKYCVYPLLCTRIIFVFIQTKTRAKKRGGGGGEEEEPCTV